MSDNDESHSSKPVDEGEEEKQDVHAFPPNVIEKQPEKVYCVSNPQSAAIKRGSYKKSNTLWFTLDTTKKEVNSALKKLTIDDKSSINNGSQATPRMKKTQTRKLKAVERLIENSSIKSEKRFLDEFTKLVDMVIDRPNATNIQKLRFLFESKGFRLSDPRISYIFTIVNELEKDNKDINFQLFKDLIKPWYTFFRKILQNHLTLNDILNFSDKTKRLFDKLDKDDMGGFIPEYISQLSHVNENDFWVSICTVEGQRLNFGKTDTYACMDHITSVVSYLIALEQHGQEIVSSYIGTEPSGQLYDSLELKDGLPHNPLISSGILTSCSLLFQDETWDRKYEKYANVVKKLTGGAKVDFNNEMYLSEISRADRNLALLYMLKEADTLPSDLPVKEILQFYTQTWCIELKIEEYAILAASLANGGIWPITEERVFSDPDAIKGVLSQMLSWGMNTYSGKWAFKAGLPCKTSVSGVTIMVIPNFMGIAVYSPKLDKNYNSKKSQIFLSNFVKLFGYDSIDHIYGAGIISKLGMKSSLGGNKEDASMNLLYFSKQNKIRDIRKWVAKGGDINFRDYDHRTALHMAANFGNFEIVKYLVFHGAQVNAKDRFNNTPIDEAREWGYNDIVEFMENPLDDSGSIQSM